MTIIKYLDNNDSAGIGVYEIGSETVVSLEALRKEHVQRESHGCFKRNTASYEQNFVGIVISYALIAPKTAKGGQYGGSAVEERFADRIMRIADAMSPDGNIAALKFVNASESQSGLSHLLNGNLNGMRILLKDVILREGEEGGFVGDSDIPVLLAQGGIFPLQDLSSIWAFKTITSTKIASRTRSVTRAVLFPNCYLDVSNITYKEANCNGSFCDRTMATSIVNEKEAKCICIRSRVQSVGGRMVLSMNLQLYSAVDADGNVSGDPMSIRFSPFQSLAWSKFLLGTTIQSTNSDIVELNQGIKHMVDFVRQRVIAVNKNRGWFVYGWYKLGMQQNKTDTKTAAAASSSGGTSGSNFKLKGRQQDDAGGHMGATEVLYHAVKIMPTMITAYMGNNAGAHEYVFQKDVNENRMVRGEAANDTLNERKDAQGIPH